MLTSANLMDSRMSMSFSKSPSSIISGNQENLEEIKSELSKLTGVLMQKDSHYQKIIQDMITVSKSQSEIHKEKDTQLYQKDLQCQKLMRDLIDKDLEIKRLQEQLSEKDSAYWGL